MKSIENKTVTINKEEVTYAKLLQSCIDMPPQGGYSVKEMSERLAVKTAIDKAKKTIDLEDAYYAKAKECVDNMRWGIADIALVNFSNCFK